MNRFLLLSVLVLAGCAGREDAAQPAPTGDVPVSDGAPSDGASELLPAPWAAASLAGDAVPAVYVAEWSRADNRASCALIAPATVEPASATARAATFGGGWGVAYDLPELRSAFGVAGTGATTGGDVYDAWPHRIEWSDGSAAGYGPEGGSGPNQLAYVEIAGQGCLYNVWSRLGVDHLERLLGRLRFVETP